MTYKVYGNTLLIGSADKIEDTQEFEDFNEALDYYRQLFKSQAEDISDYGGEHTIMMYSDINDSIKLIKRNTISTTSNNE